MRALVLVIALVACGPKSPAGTGTGSAVTHNTLYDRLGGRDAIIGIVEDFLANVAADKRINKFFDGVDTQGLKQKLVDQLCEAANGPCKYTGRDMKTTHAGMSITDVELKAFIEDLEKSLDKFKVADAERKELLGILNKMHDDIVTAK